MIQVMSRGWATSSLRSCLSLRTRWSPSGAWRASWTWWSVENFPFSSRFHHKMFLIWNIPLVLLTFYTNRIPLCLPSCCWVCRVFGKYILVSFCSLCFCSTRTLRSRRRPWSSSFFSSAFFWRLWTQSCATSWVSSAAILSVKLGSLVAQWFPVSPGANTIKLVVYNPKNHFYLQLS